jgi:hypothetical protein
MIVDYYRDHRIDVNAVEADGRWSAEVRIRRTLSSKCLIADAVMLAQEPPELLGHRYAFLGRILLDRAMERLGKVQGETLYADWRLRRYTPYPSCLWVCPLRALCGCVGQFCSSPRRRVTSNFYVWNRARPGPHSPDA